MSQLTPFHAFAREQADTDVYSTDSQSCTGPSWPRPTQRANSKSLFPPAEGGLNVPTVTKPLLIMPAALSLWLHIPLLILGFTNSDTLKHQKPSPTDL